MNKFRAIACAAALAAQPALAFDIPDARTEAAIQGGDLRPLTVAVEVKANLDGVPPEPIVPTNVVIGWEEVGGISPTPFMVFLPAACWERGRASFDAVDPDCGAEATLLDRSGAEVLLRIEALEARFSQRGEGEARAALELVLNANGMEQDLLSALGGGQLSIAIGREQGLAPLLAIQAAMGIQPQPF